MRESSRGFNDSSFGLDHHELFIYLFFHFLQRAGYFFVFKEGGERESFSLSLSGYVIGFRSPGYPSFRFAFMILWMTIIPLLDNGTRIIFI